MRLTRGFDSHRVHHFDAAAWKADMLARLSAEVLW